MQKPNVCVCGAGTMGSGIAQVAASAGYATLLYEVNEAVLNRAKDNINLSLEKLVAKGKLTPAAKDQIQQRIQFTSTLEDCKADIIVEAIIEKVEAKVELFTNLMELNTAETIYTSNTSSLSITAIAQALKYAHRFAGLHFFNPAPLMKLVEVVKGTLTEDSVIQTLCTFVSELSKTPVVCKDAPGFIVNRVARPFYIEALRLAEEDITPLQTIDALLVARGFKMGPFSLMDLIGNDVNYAVSQSVYQQLNCPERLKPSHLQKEKVEKNELGKKTGKGYYDYHPDIKK